MTTIGLKLSRTGEPGDVCHHSGMTREECDYLCHSCSQSFVPCPNRATVYERAAAVRLTWPQSRLDKQELREWDMEIPQCTKVTDRMRRKTEPHEQR